MSSGKGLIGLKIAKRTKPSSSSFNYRANAVEQWVQDLPLGNVGAMSKLLYNALREVNRLIIDWRDRQRFLELLRQPVAYVDEQLQQRFTGVTFPLSAKTRQVAVLSRSLSAEMALGYKTAIEDMLGSGFLGRDNKALPELTHRAVHYLSHALLTCYKTYAPPPEDSWFELNMLYLHAEYKGIQSQRVNDPINSTLSNSSIARLYRQILLLALASPYRMRQGEAQAVYTALARWAGHAKIVPYNDPEAAKALFVVHMDRDDAPDFQAFDHRDCDTELCRLVDTRQLSQVLLEELGQLQKRKVNHTGVPAELLYRLIRTWGVAPKRSFNRNDKEDSLEVVIGLAKLHQALAVELGDESQLRDRASYQSRSVIGVSQPTSSDIWNAFSKESLGLQYQNYQMSLHDTEKQPANDIQRHHWHISNESAGGYRLVTEQNDGSRVQVGELLGLRRRHSSHHPYEAGVVRWLRQSVDGGLELGVQVLAPQLIPIMIRQIPAKGSDLEFQPALLLPEVSTIGLEASLITPIRLFRSGMELQLHHSEQDVRLHLSRHTQETGCFSQFRFESKEQQQQTPPTISKEDGPHFNWDEL